MPPKMIAGVYPRRCFSPPNRLIAACRPGRLRAVTDPLETVRRAGFEALGTEGTVEEVRAVWRAFSSVSAVPTVRIADGDPDPSAVETAWARVVDTTGLVSSSGEFLLSVSATGTHDAAWLRVQAGADARVLDLGPRDGEPDFVATNVGRTVSVAVTSEEDETWILVSVRE
ncbi:hypothetical protein ACFQ80_05315 [Isoptericola sp. NPDC056578]|uniref:hypothetical protein n=1 Tax=Isoptericola sp. NPDC056578 TaxID=3345870 RepID=UPI00368B1C6B